MNEMRREPLTRDEVEYWCNEVDCSGILQFTAEALLNHDAAQREQLRALAARLAKVEADHAADVEHIECRNKMIADLQRQLATTEKWRDVHKEVADNQTWHVQKLRQQVARLTEELEAYAWTISPAMAQAKIDELHEEVARLRECLEKIHNHSDVDPLGDCAMRQWAGEALRETGAR